MTKQETTTRLNDYLDGELGPAQVAAFEDALSKDPALRAELESIQAAMELLRTEGPLQAPTGFHERVMAQAAVEPMPQIGWMDRLRRFFRDLPMETLAMAVAATIVLVLGVVEIAVLATVIVIKVCSVSARCWPLPKPL